MWRLAERDSVPVVKRKKECQGHIIIAICLDNLGFMKLSFVETKCTLVETQYSAKMMCDFVIWILLYKFMYCFYDLVHIEIEKCIFSHCKDLQ